MPSCHLLGSLKSLRRTGQMSGAGTEQMSAAETGLLTAVEARQMLKSQIGSRALNGRKWFEIHPEWSPGLENRPKRILRPFPSVCDGSAASNLTKRARNSRSGSSWPLLLGSTAPNGGALVQNGHSQMTHCIQTK